MSKCLKVFLIFNAEFLNHLLVQFFLFRLEFLDLHFHLFDNVVALGQGLLQFGLLSRKL